MDLAEASSFFDEAVGRIQAGGIDRLIVDLRRNSGGNSAPGTRFAQAVSGLPAMNRDGGLAWLDLPLVTPALR